MVYRLIAACVLLCALPVNAEARQIKLHPECNITMPCVAPYASTPDQVRVARGRYVARSFGIGAAIEKPTKIRKNIPRNIPKRAFYRVSEPPSIAGLTPAITRPARYIAGRLVCAINVGAALAERGIKGTGSALARSYDGWGHRSGPVVGAVAVTDRPGGGHVAIVSRVEGSRVFVWNPGSRGRGWREVEYTGRRAHYRVAA